MWNELEQRLQHMAGDRIKRDEPMSRHTSFHIGGPADLWFSPADADEIRQALEWCREWNVPVTVLGNGSNLIVSDKGLEGLVIQMGEDYARVEVRGDEIFAQAGARLSSVCKAAQQAGLSGLEFAYGIPGCVGGAVTMDAGAYGGEVGGCIRSVEALDGNHEIREFTAEEMHFSYRHSRVMEENIVVLSAVFTLTKDDPEKIRERMEDYSRRRRDKQPLNLPSAGSVFKRPEGYYAGQLIEEAGLKGVCVGDAQVSEKHAGFIVNIGQASARDVEDLIRLVQDRVFANSGVKLEPEIRMIGRK